MPSSARCRSPINHRPAAAKREAAQCDDHPDALRTIHHGTAVSTSQKTIACPKAIQNRRLHRYADPRTARRHEGAGARLSDFFSWTVHCAAVGGFAAYGCGVPLAGTARFSFGKAKREMGGASAQPSAWLHTPSRHCDSRPLAGPPIAPLPRNRLASSAAGGASAISPRPMGRLPKKGQGGQAPFSRNLLTASPAPAAPAPCRAGPTG